MTSPTSTLDTENPTTPDVNSPGKWLLLLVYFAILIAPLVVVLIGPRPGPREFWRELSVALGFGGLALVGMQFIPTTRLRPLSNLFSMDDVYYFHPRAALIGFLLILAHPLILILFNPTTVQLLNPLTAPARAIYGLVSLLSLVGLMITSIFRKQLHIRYEIWHALHTALAVVMVITAMLHILLVDYYLSLPWQRALWVGLTVIWVGLVLNRRLVRPIIQSRHPYRIVSVEPVAEGVTNIVLEPDGHTGITFRPGQFAWLVIDGSPFGMRTHPFSIASSAERPSQLHFTIGAAGDFTNRIPDLPVGTVVYLDGPHGTFSIDVHPGPGYVFIAGGIGSPPIMSMLRTMADRGSRKPVWFFYGNQTMAAIAYRDELEMLKERLDLRVIHVLEDAPSDWDGETGFIDADLLQRHLPDDYAGLVYFICGPVPMIDAVVGALEDSGVPLEYVFSEQYDMV